MAHATLRDGGSQDPFDLYADWRADEELSESRRATLRWAAAAVVVMLSGYGLLQALTAG